MKYTLISIVTIFATFTVFGQILKREDGETAGTFANRLKPDSTELVHSVIETASLDTTKKVVIAFFKRTIYETRQMDTYIDYSQYDILVGYLFIPTADNNYKRELIDTIQPDGGDPEILSVFFANADQDKNKELIVLCKYDQQHADYDGAFYDAFIYDYSNEKVKYLKKLSEKFSGCECEWQTGKIEKAKYKTAKDVRAGLIKMGYIQ